MSGNRLHVKHRNFLGYARKSSDISSSSHIADGGKEKVPSVWERLSPVVRAVEAFETYKAEPRVPDMQFLPSSHG